MQAAVLEIGGGPPVHGDARHVALATDLRDVIAPAGNHTWTGGHYSTIGYKLIAEALAEALVPLEQR